MRSKKVTLARSYSDGQVAPVAAARRLALGRKASAGGHFLLSGACASTRTALSRREKILLDLSRGGAAGLAVSPSVLVAIIALAVPTARALPPRTAQPSRGRW